MDQSKSAKIFEFKFTPLPPVMRTLNLQQDSKYVGFGGLTYNRHTGIPIPPWEPTFLFRAKDGLAIEGLVAYVNAVYLHMWRMIDTNGAEHADTLAAKQHFVAVERRLQDFLAFRQNHSELLTSPTTPIALQQAA